MHLYYILFLFAPSRTPSSSPSSFSWISDGWNERCPPQDQMSEQLVPTGWCYLKEVIERLGGAEPCWRKYLTGEGATLRVYVLPPFQVTPMWWTVILFPTPAAYRHAFPALMEPRRPSTFFLKLFLVMVFYHSHREATEMTFYTTLLNDHHPLRSIGCFWKWIDVHDLNIFTWVCFFITDKKC